MELKGNITITDEAIEKNLNRLINQVYKLLPNREENLDWERPLHSIEIEFAGMNRLFLDHNDLLFSILCKLEGLLTLTSEDDFDEYRSTIFSCISLIGTLKDKCLKH